MTNVSCYCDISNARISKAHYNDWGPPRVCKRN